MSSIFGLDMEAVSVTVLPNSDITYQPLSLSTTSETVPGIGAYTVRLSDRSTNIDSISIDSISWDLTTSGTAAMPPGWFTINDGRWVWNDGTNGIMITPPEPAAQPAPPPFKVVCVLCHKRVVADALVCEHCSKKYAAEDVFE